MESGRSAKHGWGVIVFVALTFFVIPCLQADIYVYIDSEGVFHFTNTPTSSDYKIYLRERSLLPRAWYNIEDYDDVISEAARQNGLSFPLLKALIHVESYFNPRAVSKKGAMGLMQIMPENMELLNISNPFDPWENIMGGARYLKAMLDRFDHRLPLALAAYNAGPTAVERYKDIPPFKETQSYVEKVMKFFHFYNKS
ncbi:MAG: lytic transglycosylase domain-containing protein [Desulfobacteraceae bacterium]|nr:MAG: lytic transglycosylase domain-containing protein [Desulfobacteraceae bacterium]